MKAKLYIVGFQSSKIILMLINANFEQEITCI